MDYHKINDIKIDGSGNLVLQDVSGSTVTINYNDSAEFNKLLLSANESVVNQIKTLLASQNNSNAVFVMALEQHFGLPTEVRAAKQQIAQKVAELKHLALLLQEGETNANETAEDETVFAETDFDQLLLAIENGDCVLFLGPELALDDEGRSLHEKYFESLADKTLFYDKNDGFFHPGNISKMRNSPPKFYENDFPQLNKLGNSVLRKLAQIPFRVIVSYCPDDSMSRIFKKFNIEHTFWEYNASEITEDIDWSKPFIYNALGNLAKKGGKYILTYEDFDKYIRANQSFKIPVALENRIKDATQFIFLGFDFNKWYFRLLLFLFDFQKGSKLLAFERKGKIEPNYQSFMNKQFSICFENSRYDAFADMLLCKSRQVGLCKPLTRSFVESILEELETIRIKSIDNQKLELLLELNNRCEILEQKMIDNQQ